MESAQILQFPQAQRQTGTARIAELTDGRPSQCRLPHTQKMLKIIGVLDMPHQWQINETISILHNNNRAIVTGCTTTPDNRFNLTIELDSTEINLICGEDSSGNKAPYCRFLCEGTNITISDSIDFQLDMETLNNSGLWCLFIIGFNLYVR